jgi:serine/threonine-protein kinase
MGDRELDARSDVYSLGAMLYEMLAGDPPYTGSTAQAIVAKVITEKAPPVTTHRDTVPPHIAAATAKALSKLPADRFTSAAQFAEALTNPAFTLPTTAAAAVPGAAPQRAWNRLTVSLAGLAAVFFAAALWGWLRPEPPMPILRYSMALHEDEALLSRFGGNLALSPDGSRMVYIGPGEAAPPLWLRERNQLRARPLPGTQGATAPTFSPDGQRVAFMSLNPFSLSVVSLGGEPPVTLAEGRLQRAGISWGPNGYLYVGVFGPLVRVPETGGPPEAVSVLDTAQGETAHNFPHALPNGRGVLVTVFHTNNAQTHDVGVVDLATGEHRVLVRGVYGRYASSGHLVFVRQDGALLAAPFDQDELALTGPAVPLLEGIRVRQLGDPDVALSEAGTLAYVAGDVAQGGSTALWVDRDGTAQVADPGWTFNFAGNGGLALSPDGTRLALRVQEATADVWVKELDRGPLSRLTFEGDRNFRPQWTPDGRSIAFLSTRQSESYDLYQKRADGTGPPELLLDFEQRVVEAIWAPDGQWLVFRLGGVGGTLGERDIWGLRPGVDSVPVEVVVTPADEKVAAISPDGRWLAYESNETGREEIFVRPFPNTGDGKWQVSIAGGTAPLWAHSGSELFYLNGNAELVAADVLTTPTFSVGERRALFSAIQYFRGANARHYDITPDDQRFLFVGPSDFAGGDASRELIVVENFLEELQEKVGTP